MARIHKAIFYRGANILKTAIFNLIKNIRIQLFYDEVSNDTIKLKQIYQGLEDIYKAIKRKAKDTAWNLTYSIKKSKLSGQVEELSRKVAGTMTDYETAIKEAKRRNQNTNRTADE